MYFKSRHTDTKIVDMYFKSRHTDTKSVDKSRHTDMKTVDIYFKSRHTDTKSVDIFWTNIQEVKSFLYIGCRSNKKIYASMSIHQYLF